MGIVNEGLFLPVRAKPKGLTAQTRRRRVVNPPKGFFMLFNPDYSLLTTETVFNDETKALLSIPVQRDR